MGAQVLLAAVILSLVALEGRVWGQQCDKYVHWKGPLPSGGQLRSGPTTELQCKAACSLWKQGIYYQCSAYGWDEDQSSCTVYGKGYSKPNFYVTNCNDNWYPGNTTPTTCPPVEGLGSGLVILISIFCVIFGILMGMAITFCACPNKVHGYKAWASERKGMERPIKFHSNGCSGDSCQQHQSINHGAGPVYSVGQSPMNGQAYNVSLHIP